MGFFSDAQRLTWTIEELKTVLKARQGNQFDGNIAVSGDRGNGKSTLIAKLFYKLGGYQPEIHQVYDRVSILKLLRNQKFGLCFDDEAINSGYKREFQNKGQQELIKFLTAYRDNYNVYASAIPNFFSLDKDLRDLYFLHFHVIERGLAVVHMPLQNRLYSQDRWDARNNAKIEIEWGAKIQKNPNFKPPFHQLSTFRGYLIFKDITPTQRALYLEIKQRKRRIALQIDAEKEYVPTFEEKLFKQLIEGKLTKIGILQACAIEGANYRKVRNKLNDMVKNEGSEKTFSDFLIDRDDILNDAQSRSDILSEVPGFE